jgi:glutamine amidotransferase
MTDSDFSVSILDLGINNINSVRRAIQQNAIGAGIKIESEDSALGNTRLIILPGLGSFAAGMEQLRQRNLDRYLSKANKRGIAIVGICLGMQLLGEGSEESPGIEGLGLIKGKNEILPFYSNERIPNTGWLGGVPENEGSLFPALGKGKDFYFVHSYHFKLDNPKDSIFKSKYGDVEITTGIKHHSVMGFQFHPEKSSNIGNELIQEIIEWGFYEG